MNGFFTSEGHFSFYNVLERSFLGVFLFFLHILSSKYYPLRPNYLRQNKLPQSLTITTTSDTRDICHDPESSAFWHPESSTFLHPEPPTFAPGTPRFWKPTTITTTYHVLPRHTTYYQPFCTPNLRPFCTSNRLFLHAESSAFGTPNLRPFAPRTFYLVLQPGTSHTIRETSSILHAESSAFSTPNLLPFRTPNLLLLAHRIFGLLHLEPSTLFCTKPTTTTTIYPRPDTK
jgi:hypothetical protein